MRLQPQRAWLNDRWRNLRGYTAGDGTWRFVGAGALVVTALGAVVIAGGGARGGDALGVSHSPAPTSSRFNGWAGYRAPTTTQAPPTTVAAPAPVVKHAAPPRAARSTAAQYGSGACGGDLPPCWVMQRESHGNINAYNPTGCGGRGCYGKWQCDPRTCSGKGTEAQQDAEAAALWDHGRGCSHWAAC